MPTAINIRDFLEKAKEHPVIDVRTPAEFSQGHIPGAINIPLFSNEDRVIVGTCYKKEGKQPAILKGLELIGPKLHQFIQQANAVPNSGTLLLHCWRGGMRSGSMAWLFESYGFTCFTLKGGYKNFRQEVLGYFKQPQHFLILGGRTGSGKTEILRELKSAGEQVIDLEQLAHHKGSSYGSIGEEKQGSQEHFENELYRALKNIDPKRICWLEDESRKIGINVLPDDCYSQMRNAALYYIELPHEERVNYLVDAYGKFPIEALKEATARIGKKLGGQHVKTALEALENGDLRTACEVSLVYYDKSYDHGVSQREKEKVKRIPFDKMDPHMIANELILQTKNVQY